MLDLVSVEIDGFLSHGNTGCIPLNQPGITIIQGATGTGKSSVLDVVSYLIRGETSRKVRLVDDLINKVTDNGYDIALNYRVDSNSYRVQEVRGRKGAGLYFWENGEQISSKTVVDLRKKILESIKMAPDDFCAIAFMAQNQFNKLAYGTSSTRATELIRIYGLNQYDIALKACGKDIEKSLDDRKVLFAKVESSRAELVRLEDQFNANAKDSVVCPDETKLAALQLKIREVEELLQSIRLQEGKAREVFGKATMLHERNKLLEGIRKEITTIQQELSTLAESKHSAEKLQSGLDAVKLKVASASAIISQAQANLKSVDDLGEKCPINCEICPTGVPIQYKAAQVAKHKGVIGEQQDLLNGFSKKIEVFKRLLTESLTRKKLEEKLKDRCGELDVLAVNETLPDLSVQTKEVQQFAELINQNTAILRSLNAEYSALVEAKAAYESVKNYRIKTKQFIDEHRKGLLDLQAAIATHDNDHQYLVTVLNILKKAKAYKIDYVINLLNERIQDNLDHISNGTLQAFCSSQRKDSTGKKLLDSIEIIVSDSYKEIPFELASGGQQTQVCLAFLSAIFETARTVTQKAVSSLWLDEVFGPISNDTLDRVFEALVYLSKRIGVSSIKIISHKELDSRFIDHIWTTTLENGVTTLSMQC